MDKQPGAAGVDKSKLKELALAAKAIGIENGTSLTPAFLAFTDEATPDAILGLLAELERATRALVRGGFEDRGGEEWAPPIGPAPRFIEVSNEAARNAALEEVASWYADKGWLMDEDDVPAAIRSLATAASTESAPQTALPARRFANVTGFADADYVEFLEGETCGGGVLKGVRHKFQPYTRSEAEQCVRNGVWREVPIGAVIEVASRGAAQGRITQDSGGSSPADAGGLTRYDAAVTCGSGVVSMDEFEDGTFVKYADVCALLATKAAQPDFIELTAGEKEQFATWAGIHYRNAACYTERDYNMGLAAWKERASRDGSATAPSAKQEPSDPLASEKEALRRMSVQGMADCMDMVRSDLVEMGIIDKSVAPMFIPEAVAAYVKRLAAPSASASPAAPNAQQQPCGQRDYCSRFPFCGCGEPSQFPERDQSKPAEQQGLFEKFRVQRLDGSDCGGGKHYGCRYFVLDLNHDQHAPAAMRAYAVACRATHPQLADDIEAEFGAAPVAGSQQVPDALRLLGILFDSWENGVNCYEDPEEFSGYLGNAFRLDDDVFKSCCDLLNKHGVKQFVPPVATAAPAVPVPAEQQWISVEERLPEQNRREVLAWCEGNRCYYAAHLETNENGTRVWRDFATGKRLPELVTHWTLFPAAPSLQQPKPDA